MNSISLVIPLHNCADRINELISRAIENLEALNLIFFEIILVDDASRDATAEVISQRGRTCQHLRLLKLKENHGQQRALANGIANAKGSLVATIDDDFSHDPQNLRLLLNEMLKGYDLVYATPLESRRASLRYLTKQWLCVLYGAAVRPTGFRLFKRELMEGLVPPRSRFFSVDSYLWKCSRATGSCPVEFPVSRRHRTSQPWHRLLCLTFGIIYDRLRFLGERLIKAS